MEQAVLLRSGKLAQADIDHIAEEIDSLGRTPKRKLVSGLTLLLLHLLKWRFQPALSGRSWRLSVEGQRLDVETHLADNPSLKAGVEAAIAQAYRRALIDAERETGFEPATFPAACPSSFEQVMDTAFWPESNSRRKLERSARK
jgi:hypothetical protein